MLQSLSRVLSKKKKNRMSDVVQQQEPPKSESQKSGKAVPTVMRGGREFHDTKSVYWLPSDDEEMDRLIGQHFALKNVFDGNFCKEILDKVPMQSGTRVLDIGCGPGTWIMDVATEYPELKLVGIDLVDVFPSNIRPPNVTFDVGNILDGLAFPDNSFDVINMRFFLFAFRKEEWTQAYKEAERLLKPGGYFQVWECAPLVYGREYISNVGKSIAKLMDDKGQMPFIADHLDQVLTEAKLEVLELDKKMVDLGDPSPTNRECLWDVINVLRSTQPFMAPLLGYDTDEAYVEFTKQFAIEAQMDPHAYWKVARALGQKPQ
ncbi:S-adenosyl-L-methionine-dependent methyltransferase [Gongronella butleri]|nr:S-adenosyl-L-methionine-dependent methyltransferase [Gongronella butleri]